MDWYYWLFRFFYFSSVIVSSVFWSLENASGWWWSVLAALCGLYISQMMYLSEQVRDVSRIINILKDNQVSGLNKYHNLVKNKKMTRYDFCNRLSSVYDSMMVLRSLAFCGVLTAWAITLVNGESFVSNEEVEWVRWSWFVASLLWLVSLLPLLVSLFQCLIDHPKKRSGFMVWLLHDLVLGGFWVYLSYELYDLPNDSDDSAWRSLFRSMIAWHGVIVLFQEIYRGGAVRSCDTKCFSKESKGAWAVCLRLLGLLSVYVVILIRFEQSNETGLSSVLSMGLSTPLLVFFILGVVCIAIGVYVESLVGKKNDDNECSGVKYKIFKKSEIQF